MVVSGKPVVNFERCKAMHEEKLRRHFIGGCKCKEDVSSLIIGTMAISAELKRLGKMSDARKFESYVDVLMFGNQTIDESLDDVMQLVRGRRPI
jgi:hypothetical protein